MRLGRSREWRLNWASLPKPSLRKRFPEQASLRKPWLRRPWPLSLGRRTGVGSSQPRKRVARRGVGSAHSSRWRSCLVSAFWSVSTEAGRAYPHRHRPRCPKCHQHPSRSWQCLGKSLQDPWMRLRARRVPLRQRAWRPRRVPLRQRAPRPRRALILLPTLRPLVLPLPARTARSRSP
jgi:hypothetical protein